jgi:hypothetical protein
MTPIELRIWEAAFAAEFSARRESYFSGRVSGTIDDVSGFECGEVADVAVEKYREWLRDRL